MFKIMGRYKDHDEEEIDSFETRPEAEEMLVEYRIAFGRDIKLRIEEGND